MHTVITNEEAFDLTKNGGKLPDQEVVPPIWRESGPDADPRAKLKGVWTIGGFSMHVVALAVHLETDELGQDGEFVRADFGAPEAEAIITAGGRMELDDHVEGYDIGELWTAHGMEGHSETLAIDGRHYIVFACPFCT